MKEDLLPALIKIAAAETLKKIIKNTLEKIQLEKLFHKKSELQLLIDKFPLKYESHFSEIIKWSTSIPFIGLAIPKNTNKSTIELIISSNIYKSEGNLNDKITEREILTSNENILLFGAPGAGKTTTIKRLILEYIRNFDSYPELSCVLLVRLRDLPVETNLYKYILDILNIKYEDKIVKYEHFTNKVDKIRGKYKEIEIREKLETFVDDIHIIDFLSSFLNKINAILILDGIDELNKEIQNETVKDIESLGLKLTTSKILATVRKSELNKIIESFISLEISSLTDHQIVEISEKWLGSSAEFVENLNKKPYKDLANRAIFLTFLLILFEKYKELPVQSHEIYEDIVYLVIKEWDEHRKITRLSKYSDFNTRKKVKFLSEVSYLLTYKIKRKSFYSKDLHEIYLDIHEKYNLPSEEMKSVVSEIESHTGLISESSYKQFEFSHLSIQEYLCAKYLVNLPYSNNTIKYFSEYPEPLAIATCLSGDSSLWLSNLILNRSLNVASFKGKRKEFASSMFTFLNRLSLESPNFKISEELGYTFLYIISEFSDDKNFIEIIGHWFEDVSVKKSISIALSGNKYTINHLDNKYLIQRITVMDTSSFIDVPIKYEISSHLIENLVTSNLISLENSFFL